MFVYWTCSCVCVCGTEGVYFLLLPKCVCLGGVRIFVRELLACVWCVYLIALACEFVYACNCL